MPTKLVLLSDTHGRHDAFVVPPCDVLIHAGDATRRGTEHEVSAFLAWLGRQPARHKVFVSGNHDHFAEREPAAMERLCQAAGVEHLVDRTVELGGLRIHGTPVTPWFRGMAWNRRPGPEMEAHTAKIPAGLDVLVTHGPPLGTLDRTFFGRNVGCASLAAVVAARGPRLHVFGHIHEAAGRTRTPTGEAINAASLSLLRRSRPPHVVDLPPST